MSNADRPAGGPRDQGDTQLTRLARLALQRRRGSLPTTHSDLDDELLLRYLDGALGGGEREALERRLLLDADAKDRLLLLSEGLEEAGIAASTPAPTMAERAANVARTVFHVAGGVLDILRGGEGLRPLAAATVRGGTATGPSGYVIERDFDTAQGPLAARFELHADRPEAATGHTDQATPLVDLVVHVGQAATPVDGVRCKLFRDGRPIDSREVEAQGCTFTRLSPARYDIELRKGGVELGRVLFDLRG